MASISASETAKAAAAACLKSASSWSKGSFRSFKRKVRVSGMRQFYPVPAVAVANLRI
jgi:hypothetical protein